jgi:hypothetical protein
MNELKINLTKSRSKWSMVAGNANFNQMSHWKVDYFDHA